MYAFFLSFRNRLAQNFPTIFTEGSADEPAFDKQTQFARKWGWYTAISEMANGDLTKFDAITELPARTCFTFLEYTMDKADVEKSLLNKKQH